MKDKRLQINVTFKQKEKWLYDLLMKFSSPSAVIKDILIESYRKGEKND